MGKEYKEWVRYMEDNYGEKKNDCILENTLQDTIEATTELGISMLALILSLLEKDIVTNEELEKGRKTALNILKSC